MWGKTVYTLIIIFLFSLEKIKVKLDEHDIAAGYTGADLCHLWP